MKILSLMTAAAAALSLGLAGGAPANAATFKPNPGPLAAITYLGCETLLNVSPGSHNNSVRIRNTSGVVLKPGARIHIVYTYKGQQKTTSSVLAAYLPKGASVQVGIGPYDFVAGCTAQVDLLASPGPTIKPPLPDRPGQGPGPRSH